MADKYTPEDGLRNTIVFPTDPADEAAAREQIQGMFDQILGFHNEHLADSVTDADGAHGLKIEEGTFNPTIAGSIVAGTNTYLYQLGGYYKIGRLVHFEILVGLSAKDAAMSGNVLVRGLPFVILCYAQVVYSLHYGGIILSSGFTEAHAYSVSGTSEIILAQSGSNQVAIPIDSSQIRADALLWITGDCVST